MPVAETFDQALRRTQGDFDRVFGEIKHAEPAVRRMAEHWLAALRFLGVDDGDIFLAMTHHDAGSYATLLRQGQAAGGADFAQAVSAVRDLAIHGDSNSSTKYSRQMIQRVVGLHH